MLKSVGIASALLLGLASQAGANTVYKISLSGNVADLTSAATVIFAGARYDIQDLQLAGLDGTNAISPELGDEIDATVKLDQPLTIPASQLRTDVGLLLTSLTFPVTNTATNGTFTLFLNGVTVAQQSGVELTSSQLATGVQIFPPDNKDVTFDSFESDFTIRALDNVLPSNPVVLDTANIEIVRVSAAPEPSTWALMLAGVGGMGAALRARRRRAEA